MSSYLPNYKILIDSLGFSLLFQHLISNYQNTEKALYFEHFHTINYVF